MKSESVQLGRGMTRGTKRISPLIIGEIGEYVACKWLRKKGFEVFSFGRGAPSGASRRHLRADAKEFSRDNVMPCLHSDEQVVALLEFYDLNELVTKFMRNEWEAFAKNHKPPFATYEIAFTEKRGEKELAEMMRKENMASLDSYPFGGGDRFDFVAIKDGEVCAIEIKVNKSRLKKGQQFRLKTLISRGFKVYLAKVSIGEEAIDAAADGVDISEFVVALKEDLDLSGCDIPPFEEFLARANYVSEDAKRYQELLDRTEERRADIP